MEKRVHLLLSAADHEVFNGAAHDARVSLAAWVRMACREKLRGPSKRTVADSIARFEAVAPPVATEAQEFAERIVPAMVENASNVITAPARKVPLPPSKCRVNHVVAALKEASAACDVVPGPDPRSLGVYLTTPMITVFEVPEIPDFEELRADVSVPIQVPHDADVVSVGYDGDPNFAAFSKPIENKPRPKFKRHPNCVTEKCERLGPSCELCRLANTVSF